MALRVRELLAASGVSQDEEGEEDEQGAGSGYGELDGDGEQVGHSSGAVPTRWQQWQARVPLRIDPGHRAAWGVGAAVALAALITALWLMSSRPSPVPVAARVPAVPGSALVGSAGAQASARSPSGASSSGGAQVTASPAAGPAGPAGVVVVDVAGKVVHPGLYRLPTGSRVDDAITAAGGPRRGVDLSSLNLAAPLADGQQILVGVPGAGVQGPVAGTGAAATGSGGAGGTAPVSGPVNLNTAGLEQLDALPGVGPVLAQHILDWRGEHGRFTAVDQLNDVSGIGDVKFAELKDLVTV